MHGRRAPSPLPRALASLRSPRYFSTRARPMWMTGLTLSLAPSPRCCSWTRAAMAAMAELGLAASRCSALPLSKPTVPSYSSHHAAPPALPRRPCHAPQHWCRLPPACMARPRRAIAEQAAAPYECAPTPWCFPTTSPSPTSLLRPTSTSSSASSVHVRVKDLALKFVERGGPNCEVYDSNE